MRPAHHRPSGDYDFDVISGPAMPVRPAPAEPAAPVRGGGPAPSASGAPRPAESVPSAAEAR